MTEYALFDIPEDQYVTPPEPENPSRSERRKRLVNARISQGTHPLGYISLHPDAPQDREAPGPRCGDCIHRVAIRHHDKSYPKCHYPTTVGGQTRHLRDTHGEASDIRAWWPACITFQGREGTGNE